METKHRALRFHLRAAQRALITDRKNHLPDSISTPMDGKVTPSLTRSASMGEELTIHEAAADPLINQVLKADGVPPGAFAQLLQSAARLRANELEKAVAADGTAATDDADQKARSKSKATTISLGKRPQDGDPAA
jgi:hypothetical protein